jgi:hypothetical protein
MAGVLAHPSRFFRQPSPREGLADIEALRRGETRKVACWLRGSPAPFRPHLRQGWLYLSSRDAQWKPFWSIRRPSLPFNDPVESVTTRSPDDREPAAMKGGTYGLIVVRPKWGVVTCRAMTGWFEMAVPAPDVPLVVDHFIPARPPPAA